MKYLIFDELEMKHLVPHEKTKESPKVKLLPKGGMTALLRREWNFHPENGAYLARVDGKYAQINARAGLQQLCYQMA